MLKLLKKISHSHEELFIEHYDRMLGWSLQLTERDRDLAEDLLHDAFIQFTALTQPDLNKIQNLDGYLYMMLRNLHISQERRSSRARFQQLSIVEYESAATGLRTIDSRDLIRVQDELRRVCRYACARKQKAKLASVLILRFFHGYYPSEIAKILRSPRAAIDKWLQLARAEARLAITDSEVLKFRDETPAVEFMPASFARSPEDLLRELKETIFQARQGECLTAVEIRDSYKGKQGPMGCEYISHAVSCEQCLDKISRTLNLPVLAERYPPDSVGKDTSNKGGGGDAGSGGAGGRESARKKIGKFRGRAREAFEHHPQELCVSVNGYIQGSHKISSELSEFDLSANLAEQVGFVEVFSEQGIRLLLLNADEPPPEGADTQTSLARLSDGRSVELTLKYRSTWPTLHLVYRDPTFRVVESFTESFESEAKGEAVQSSKSQVSSWGSSPTVREGSDQASNDVYSLIRKLRSRANLELGTWNLELLHRPATVTALAALLALGIFLIANLRRTSGLLPPAASLLQQSTANDEEMAARGQVVHRVVTLEEMKSESRQVGIATGSLLSRRKLEIWRSPEQGITARRLYDDRGQLVAGDWRRADGVQTIYHHGSRPQLQLAPEKRHGQTAINFENIWQLDIAARDFSSLIGNPDSARVEERGNTFVISIGEVDIPTSRDINRASSSTPAKSGDNSSSINDSSVVNSLVSARLVLNRQDLHPIEQTLVIRQGEETRAYRFVETGFELKSKDAVSPNVFEPEPEFLSANKPETRDSKLEAELAPDTRSLAPAVASAEDEVEVLRLLNQAGVFLRDQVSVVRSKSGQLIVGGIVENDERKRQIANALAQVTKTRVARVDVETVAEVLQRQQARANSETVSVEGVQVSETNIPVDDELRKYLAGAKGVSGDQLDREVRQFSERMLARSNQARLHALALKPVVERFSAPELQALTPEARAKWRSIVIDRVRAFAAETAGLRQELQPLFPSLAGTAGSSGDFDVANDADLVRAVRRLMELASANDEAVRGSFSVSVSGGKSAPVKSAQFWRSLASAEALAARIQSAH